MADKVRRSAPPQRRRRSRDCGLRERKTHFVEILRTTPPQNVCPNFYVLMHANGCTFSPMCEYCYLKSSLWHHPEPQAFTNTDRLIEEVTTWIHTDGLESCVLNTGNLSDSLTFERWRPLMADLVELFRREAEAKGRPHSLLLVTKGGVQECRVLLERKSCPNVVVSFSVNAPEASSRLEKGAAPPEDRFAAATELRDAGWRVRIRVDPMVRGYDYGWVVEEIRRLRPERVTLGALRAEANLLRVSDNSLFADLEPPANPKGYARYPMTERLGYYRTMITPLADLCSIGLCEEPREVWDALGLDAESKSCNCGA